jgi:hypothetical protein
MRKLLFGLFGFVALAFGSLSLSAPAEAQPYYPGYGWGGSSVTIQVGSPRYRAYNPYRPVYRPAYRPYRAYYRPYRAYRPYTTYYRPVYVAPRCFTRTRQIWNGYRWVWRPVRVCRR